MKCNRTQEECTAPGVCLELGCQGKLQQGFGNVIGSAVGVGMTGQRMDTKARIYARFKRLDEIEASYISYLHDRIKERDWHGGWDACVNLSEVSCERDGLQYALAALGEAE